MDRRGSAKNWPPRSPDLNALDYHVWSYMKAMVHVRNMNKTEKLPQRIISAARCINTSAVFLLATSFPITQVRKCIKADGGHFEQLE